jgi:hypothetical protein
MNVIASTLSSFTIRGSHGMLFHQVLAKNQSGARRFRCRTGFPIHGSCGILEQAGSTTFTLSGTTSTCECGKNAGDVPPFTYAGVISTGSGGISMCGIHSGEGSAVTFTGSAASGTGSGVTSTRDSSIREDGIHSETWNSAIRTRGNAISPPLNSQITTDSTKQPQ